MVIRLDRRLRGVLDIVLQSAASAMFVLMAMVAIQYDERIAPEMGRVSHAWGAMADEVGRKLASLAL